MATSLIQVDYQQLQYIEQGFQELARQVAREYQILDAHMRQLQGGGWISDAANQFYREMGQSTFPAIERLYGAMIQAAETTRGISQAFSEAEELASSYLNGDRSSIGGVPGGGAGGGFGGGFYSSKNLPPFVSIHSALSREGIKNSFQVIDALLRYGIDKAEELKSLNTTNEGLEKVLEFVTDHSFTQLVDLGSALLGGGLDYALGNEHTPKELGIQLISGLVQIPLAKVSFPSAIIQMIGDGVTDFTEANAHSLSGGNPYVENWIRQASRSMGEVVDLLDVDRWVDEATRLSFWGWEQVATNPGQVVNDVVHTYLDGVKLQSFPTLPLFPEYERHVDSVIRDTADAITRFFGL